ncbi:MAG: diaminopimelate decarboxylase, partial [Desulfosalsimonas sp.]
MPMSQDFSERLFPKLPAIAGHFGTPFHIYDEKGIRDTAAALKKAFSELPSCFYEFYAVKALPNPRILEIMLDEGFGFDCSSVPELVLSRGTGARGEQIMFTSNNTTTQDFEAAQADGGSIVNLDDISLIDRLPDIPELICFRYNPGPQRTGNKIIGNPVEAKYGVSTDQIEEAYRIMGDKGST